MDTNHPTQPIEDQDRHTIIEHQENNQCQQFFGTVSGCVFAMSGSTVTQHSAPPKVEKASKAPKNEKKAASKVSAGKPLTIAVFSKGPQITDYQIAFIYKILLKTQWITEENADMFMDLFGGKPCGCKIHWGKKVGIGNMKALLDKMVEDDIIELPEGYHTGTLIESHFINEANQPVCLHGAKSTPKAKAVVDLCLAFINGNIQAEDINSAIASAE